MNRFGKPLYGTVEAFGEKFTGYIQWDHDERLSIDKLDGESDDGDLSIEFDKIASITRAGSRCLVQLKSGREIYMEGSNDVNRENRGVIVMSKDIPSIDVPWDEFDKITFEDKVAPALVSYDQFKTQKELQATIKTFPWRFILWKSSVRPRRRIRLRTSAGQTSMSLNIQHHSET
ncbi:MAG: hypothetical protein WDO15_14060 [Bacteroidota bacterium]